MLHAALLALTLLAPQPPAAPAKNPASHSHQGVKGVPLIEVPAQAPGGNELAVLLSGDGGWAVTDKGLADRLTKGGIPVVGWNSLRYFLRRKKPDQVGHDLEKVLRVYLPLWHKEKAILIGYSFGADVMPFMVTRLPPDLADRISLIVLMGPTGTADFHFHPSEWLRKPSDDSQPMLPELEKLRGRKILCAYGRQAGELAGMDGLVDGVDIRHYMKASTANPGKCWDPGTDFADLGKAIEKRFGYTTRVKPVIVGYSSGATIVYAAMMQAPPHTFSGGLSLGFCPDLIVNHPICKGRGLSWTDDAHGKGVDVSPAKGLEDPWIAFQGDIDQICTPEDTRTYLKQVNNRELVWLHKVGHGFSVPKNWMPQFKEGFAKVTGQKTAGQKTTGQSR